MEPVLVESSPEAAEVVEAAEVQAFFRPHSTEQATAATEGTPPPPPAETARREQLL